MIYDYESFTSNLCEFPRFCEELGHFLRGYEAKRFNTHTGLEEFDLGDLILDYNKTCNVNGEFDVSKVVHMDDGSSRLILEHHVAGMLGVYGNITGSTALHGIVGLVIAGHEDRINTIGDNAAGMFDTEVMGVAEIKDQIRLLGDISDDKFEIWERDQDDEDDDVSWKFVKRPLNVESGLYAQVDARLPYLSGVIGRGGSAPYIPVLTL